MPEKFLGAEVRHGKFTSKTTGESVNYNNLVMVFAHEVEVGLCVDQNHPIVKVKNTREDILRVFGEPISMKWLNDRLGHYADIFYDVNGRVQMIRFYGPENPFATDKLVTAQPDPVPVDEGISDYSREASGEALPTDDGLAIVTASEDLPISDKKGGKK